jgi:hypothetical protein
MWRSDSGGTLITLRAATTLEDRGQRAVAEVIDVHDSRRNQYVVVRFRDGAGREVLAEVENYSWDPQPQVGDRPEVLYDPAGPEGNVADVRMGPDFFTVWACALGSRVAVALVRPTWTGRLDWARLRCCSLVPVRCSESVVGSLPSTPGPRGPKGDRLADQSGAVGATSRTITQFPCPLGRS